MILMTGWQGECDFIDPMCGSGTLPIEAALIARNIAPGVFRKEYAFEKWNDFDQDLFDHVYNDDSAEREFEHKIYGYDNNRQAIEVATRNVRAAGLTKDIELKLQDFADFQTPEKKAIIVSNPPYGERISSDDLLGLYAMIGNRLKNVFKEGDAWILSYREECFDKIGLKPSMKIPVFNGALACEFRKYQLFSGRYNDFRRDGEELAERRERREEGGEERKERRENREERGERREGHDDRKKHYRKENEQERHHDKNKDRIKNDKENEVEHSSESNENAEKSDTTRKKGYYNNRNRRRNRPEGAKEQHES